MTNQTAIKIDQNCHKVSIYLNDIPMSNDELASYATILEDMFSMDKLKVDQMIKIMKDEKWSLKRLEDSIKHVIKTNKFPTENVGLEPGHFLQFDQYYKFYTHEQMLEIDIQCRGFKAVRIKDYPNLVRGKDAPWWVLISDNTPFEDWKNEQ